MDLDSLSLLFVFLSFPLLPERSYYSLFRISSSCVRASCVQLVFLPNTGVMASYLPCRADALSRSPSPALNSSAAPSSPQTTLVRGESVIFLPFLLPSTSFQQARRVNSHRDKRTKSLSLKTDIRGEHIHDRTHSKYVLRESLLQKRKKRKKQE